MVCSDYTRVTCRRVREGARGCVKRDRAGWRDDARWLAGEWTRIGFTNLPVPVRRVRKLRSDWEVVASRRLSAAPLPWPYETHPHGGTRFPASATPVVVADPAATSPGSLFLSRKRGCSSALRSLSHPVHALIRPTFPLSLFLSLSSSSFSYISPFATFIRTICHILPPLRLLLFRFALSVTLSTFLLFLFRELHLRAGFLPSSPPSRLLNFPPENHAINVRPGNCTPLGSDVVVDQGALAPVERQIIDNRSFNYQSTLLFFKYNGKY